MKHKDLLLPYSCQKAGWIIAIAIPVLFILYALISGGNKALVTERNLHYLIGILAMLFFVAVFLICASREKDEDEMISSIRRQTLSIFIYMLFFLYFLAGIFFSLDIGLNIVKEYQGEVLGNTIIRITLFAIVYELVFKIRLWLNRRESK
jgi:preprotein translocase subunit SecG